MNTPPSDDPQPRIADDDVDDALEALLADAIGALEAEGPDAVDRLLAAHPAMASQVRRALGDLARADLLDTREPPPLARHFDDFVLGPRLGAGGMGVVHRARQVSLDRQVALKVIRPELLLFEGSRERFRREIDAVARLDHPAIVPILATGLADGVPYYAMPLLRGRTGEQVMLDLTGRDPRDLQGEDLHSALRIGNEDADAPDDAGTFAGPWWRAVVRLVRKAALGMQHAHHRGVLHRDLKPSNVLFTPAGQAIVLDFGLAQQARDSQLTHTGSTAGSPAYMAPEQMRAEPADERTDVYGLGVTLYSLLTLHRPYTATDAHHLREQVLAGQRRAPDVRAGVPPELAVVLDCAMELDRSRRYASAQAFADDLGAVLDGRPITARRLPVAIRVRRWTRRHRAASASFVVAMVCLGLLFGVWSWQQQQAKAALQVKNQELERGNRELAQLNLDLETQIARADRSVRISLDAISRLLAGTSTRKLRHRVATQEVVANMLRDALQLFDRLDLAERHNEEFVDLKMRTHTALADILVAMSDLEGLYRQTERALTLIAEVPPNAERRVAAVRMRRLQASVHMEQGETATGAAIVAALEPEVAALRTQLSAEGPADLCDDVTAEASMIAGLRAALSLRADDTRAAERALRDAMAVSAHLDLVKHVSTHGIDRLNLVRFLKGQKRYDEALEGADALIADLEPQAGMRANDEVGWPVPRYVLAMALNERARILQLADRDDESITAAHRTIRALDDLQRDYDDSPEIPRLRGSARGNLAVIHMDRKQWTEAVEHGGAAVADLRRCLQMTGDDRQAAAFLTRHLRIQVYCLRQAEHWPELEVAVREYGACEMPPDWRGSCAREALRCIASGQAKDEAGLRELVIDWLAQAHREGGNLEFGNPIYDSVRDDPRLADLR